MTLSRWYTSITFRGKYMCVTEIRLSQKSDLRGGKPVSDMIIKSHSQNHT
uniref:Uncharacterized protein n=1 Tax=Klebsiella pneumoniae TaxID=573 RepID=L7STB8_KLEPN|nr:hypothetical protein [Klebsiella pneumoniae]UCZ50167.1 hypothetical protein [Klebsiella michiganensis]AUG88882.1 hypothetical protein [Klebsiella pneumoniae]QIS34152.1 hypothetical protein [Klebsiella pneumoniae]QIS36423.1 hypothetical protein [Klebsiella pneumoniae]